MSNDWRWPNTGLTTTEGVDRQRSYAGKESKKDMASTVEGKAQCHCDADAKSWPSFKVRGGVTLGEKPGSAAPRLSSIHSYKSLNRSLGKRT